MTRWALIVLAMSPTLASAAPLSPGMLEVGGSTTLSFSSGEEEFTQGANTSTVDTKSFELDLNGLYYLTPNVSIGGFLSWVSDTREEQGIEIGLSTVLIGPAVGLGLPLQEKLALFGQAGIGYAKATFTETQEPDVEFSGWAFVLRGGLKYFVVKSFSIDGALQFSSVNLEGDATFPGVPEPELSFRDFGLSVGLTVYFGS